MHMNQSQAAAISLAIALGTYVSVGLLTFLFYMCEVCDLTRGYRVFFIALWALAVALIIRRLPIERWCTPVEQ